MTGAQDDGRLAYGGAGDRFAMARTGLNEAQSHLDALLAEFDDVDHPDPSPQLADGWSRLGWALTRALHLPPEERFESAYRAMRTAVESGDTLGSVAQRAHWWSGLGTALKNLVRDPAHPEVHERNLEASLAAHEKAVALARDTSDVALLASTLSATALAYQYRDLGARVDNLESAAMMLDEAIQLRLQLGQRTEAAVAATTCGIVWAAHPDTIVGLARATAYYTLARDHLNVEQSPAHARRLGRSAGNAACRLADWEVAYAGYALAWAGVRLGIARASDPADKRSELAEYGDASGHHVYALARSGDLQGAVDLADEYAETAAALTPGVTAQPSTGPGINHPSSSRLGLCYLVATDVGAAALLTPVAIETGRETQVPDVRLVLLGRVTTGWLKEELSWPPQRPGHGSGVVSQLLDQDALEERILSRDLLGRLAEDMVGPIQEAAATAGFEHLYLLPMGVFADSPLFATWSTSTIHARRGSVVRAGGSADADSAPDTGLTSPTRHVGASASILPAARVVRTGGRPRPGRKQLHLVTIAVENSAAGPLARTVAESEALATLFPGQVTQLRGVDATADRILGELPQATHIHFAGHGTFAHANPLATYLECVDGRLTLDALAGSEALAGAEVFIASACSLGAADAFRTPDQALGLPSVLLDRYGCTLIAPIRPVYDIAAAMFTIRTAEFLWGRAPEPVQGPAQAASQAQRWLAGVSFNALMDWAQAYPLLRLEAVFAGAAEWHTWQGLPDVWAPFSYFGP